MALKLRTNLVEKTGFEIKLLKIRTVNIGGNKTIVSNLTVPTNEVVAVVFKKI